jgi:hypothetical protein
MEVLSEFLGLDEEHARAFATAWLPAWSGNRPHDLITFYTDDAYYSDPGVPEGLRGRDALLETSFACSGTTPTGAGRIGPQFPCATVF